MLLAFVSQNAVGSVTLIPSVGLQQPTFCICSRFNLSKSILKLLRFPSLNSMWPVSPRTLACVCRDEKRFNARRRVNILQVYELCIYARWAVQMCNTRNKHILVRHIKIFYEKQINIFYSLHSVYLTIESLVILNDSKAYVNANVICTEHDVKDSFTRSTVSFQCYILYEVLDKPIKVLELYGKGV